MILKACGRCGRIHADGQCTVKRRVNYRGGEERELRNTYAWHKKAEQIKKRASYLCEVCKDQGRYNSDQLETHHSVKVKDDQELLLDDLNLICLCTMHHRDADGGKLTVEYLQELARRREAAEG